MASQTYVHLSSKSDHFIRPKVAIQPIPSLWRVRRWRGSLPGRDSSVSSALPVKKKRRGAPKVKSGCHTCKVRHVRCDETRPACTRCIETGRKCDFIQASALTSRPPIPPPRSSSLGLKRSRAIDHIIHLSAPPSPFDLTQQDGQFFQYFVKTCSTNLYSPFDTHLWTLLLQVCHTESCIRHAALGTAVMHQIYPFIVSNPSDPSFVHLYRLAFRHYAQGVKGLKEHLASLSDPANPDLRTWEVSLIASFLFTAFEILIHNEEGAYLQTESGFKLMRSALSYYNFSSGSSSHCLDNALPGNLAEITLAFNRMDIQAATFSGTWYQTKSILPPQVPETLVSTSEARDVLEVILLDILRVIRSKTPDWYNTRATHDPLPKYLATELDDLKAMLQHWLERFKESLASRMAGSFQNDRGSEDQWHIRDVIARNTLMIQYWTGFIWLHTPFSRDQTVHDPYLSVFTTITDLAQEILSLQPDRKWCYMSESQIIHSLFYVAQKCRDGIVRRRAVNLLRGAGREGVWDGQCTAAACAWIIEKEEEGLEEGVVGCVEIGKKGFVEERWRLKGASLRMNRLGRSLEISCSRNREDGTDEVIDGYVGWGQVAGVVYGEADKIWQKGSMFG